MPTKKFYLGQTAMWIALAQAVVPGALGAEPDSSPKGLKNTQAGQAIASAARQFGDRAAAAIDAMELGARKVGAGIGAGLPSTGRASVSCGMAAGGLIAAGALVAFETSPVGLIKPTTWSKLLAKSVEGDSAFLWSIVGFGSGGLVPAGAVAGSWALTPLGSTIARPLSSVAAQRSILPEESFGKREIGYTLAAGGMGGGIDILADLAWQGASKVWNGDRSTHEWGLTERGYALFLKFAPIVHSQDMSCVDKVKAIGKQVSAAIAAAEAESKSAARPVAQASFETDSRVKSLPESVTVAQGEASSQSAQGAR